VADPSQEGVYGFQEDPPQPAEGRPAPPPRPRRRPPKAPPAARPPAARAPKSKGTRLRDGVTVAVILGICISVAVFMAVRQNSQRNAEESAFRAAVGDYLFSPVEPGPVVSRPRAGKVVLVDMDKRAFDDFHLALPEEVRATSPAEVATIAQMRYTRQEVGHYEFGVRAIQLSCTMTVVDRASRTVIATRSFTWGLPPASIPRSSDRDDVTGPPPLKEITAFLTGLR
jgi:hypothetical protein